MSLITITPTDRTPLAGLAAGDDWIVACLCAGWCNVCEAFRPAFRQLAERHPDARFLWIDVEDNADLVGDIDIDDFPTVVMQRGSTVAFFGTTLPDERVIERIWLAQRGRSDAELASEAASTPQRRGWQFDADLRRRFGTAG